MARASIGGAVVNHGLQDLTVVLSLDDLNVADNIPFANDYGIILGTDDDGALTWDDTNQWVQLAIPGAGGTGLAEMRWRGDFSRAGAADTFYLNQLLPGVLTITAGVTQTTVALHAFSAAAISNAAQTVTNLYTAYFETPSTSAGTVTYRAPIGIQYGAGGILLESQSAAATPSAIEASYYAATTLDSLHLGGPGMAGSGTAGIFIQENGWVNLRATSLQLNLNVELGWGDQATYSAAPYTAIDWSSPQTNDGLVWGMATSNASLLMVAYANRNNDYARAAATNPELAIYSATAAATATDEWIAFSHNVTDGVIAVGSGNVLIGGTSSFAVAATARIYLDGGGDTYLSEASTDNINIHVGGTRRVGCSTSTFSLGVAQNWQSGALTTSSIASMKTISESVTIAAGTGLAGVASASNLIPAGSILVGLTVRVTQAPGGGATQLNVSRTSLFGSNPDELIDAIATALNTTGRSWNDGDGSVTAPPITKTADTVTLSTDADVTGASMIVRVTVHYIDLTAPTS